MLVACVSAALVGLPLASGVAAELPRMVSLSSGCALTSLVSLTHGPIVIDNVTIHLAMPRVPHATS